MRYLQIIFFTFFSLSAYVAANAQILPDQFSRPAFEYRSPQNPYYWKNKKPVEGYWQQDVQYKINAAVDEKTDIVDGKLVLTYYNNSPDELSFVYFHLYQEAFQPNTYVESLNKINNVKPTYGKYEGAGLGTEVTEVKVIKRNEKPSVETTELIQDISVLRVNLAKPIQPGENITFEIPFKTYFDSGSLRRRMKTFQSGDFTHYDGVHWYPRICVYDRKFGWDTDQHLGKEFYGDFGTFEVALTFASNYIVEATGYLENESEMLPKSLRDRLDIRNFAGKPWESEASTIIPYNEGDKKTWKYYAINVHDFAFTADPNYRIGEAMAIVDGKPVRCIALAQEGHAAFWQSAAQYTAKIIETFSNDFGPYIWPKIIVADARDGMEYPMLTLDGGYDPAYRDLFMHEVAHQWYFGMVGNNETYRASLDEGFSQFLTGWGCTKIDGKYRINFPETNRYVAKYRKQDEILMSEVYYTYIDDASRSRDMSLNTHSDMFNSALGHGGGYRQVYYKTAVMLYNLQYVLGDDLFLAAMRNYTDEWKLCHPYFDDFRHSIINFTNVDLNWFFDQWLETSKNIDYGIKSVKKEKTTNVDGQTLQNYSITFQRKGQMQMPIDFAVILASGDTVNYYIPNTWFNKNDKQTVLPAGRIDRTYFENVISLPKWYGWDKLNETYTAQITTTQQIKDVIIDPTNRLADIDMLNNSWKCPVELSFDAQIRNYKDWYNYDMKWRPELWGNAYDGLKIGAYVGGDYFGYKHKLEFTAWVNSGVGQGLLYEPEFNTLVENELVDKTSDFDLINFDLNYSTATDKFLPNSNYFLNTGYLDGVFTFETGFEKYLGRGLRDKLSVYVKDLYFNNTQYLYNNALIGNNKNNSVNIDYTHNYNYFKGNGNINFNFRSNDLLSDYNFSRINFEAINKTRLGKFDLLTRYFAQWGSGNAIPYESALQFAGANTEEMLDNKYTRSRGFFPDEWVNLSPNTGHFHAGGGLNLRGYAGYLVAEENADGEQFLAYAGASGTSINAELQFNRLFKIKGNNVIKIEPYLFADGGVLAVDEDFENISSLRIDAGIGAAFTWKWFGPLETVKPIVIRTDFPLFLNRPPYGDEYLQFRYVLGINRAF